MRRILVAVVALAVAGPPAFAQATRPDTEGGRYILRRVDGGLMRVDRDTGTTSFCRKRADTWTCELVADDRVALEDEISRLARENAELARKIGRLQERIAALESTTERKPRAPQGDERGTLDLPTEQELDQVMKTFESMMRRFLDMVRSLREDYEQDRT